MVGTGSVQDAGDLVGLLLSIVSPRWTSILGNSPEDGQQRKSDNRFLIDDVKLVADGCDTQSSAGGENGGLGEGAVSGEGYRVKDRLCLLLGVFLGNIGVEADLGGDGR